MKSSDLRSGALQLDLFGSPDLPAPAPTSASQQQPVADVAPVPTRTPPPRPAQPGVQSRCLLIGSHRLDYTLRRSKRRTIGFLINADGLRVTAPKWSSVSEIESAIRDKQHWIVSKLDLHRERTANLHQQAVQWCDGATVPYLGQPLTMRHATATVACIEHDAERAELRIALPPGAQEQDFKHSVQIWLQQQARQLFGQRLPHYAAQLGVRYQSFALSSASTQWGSCNSRGMIRLNWRLIHVTPELIDYVVAHELAHLREMNHSARFWSTVQLVYPQYAQARKQLRELGPKTLHIFD